MSQYCWPHCYCCCYSFGIWWLDVDDCWYRYLLSFVDDLFVIHCCYDDVVDIQLLMMVLSVLLVILLFIVDCWYSLLLLLIFDPCYILRPRHVDIVDIGIPLETDQYSPPRAFDHLTPHCWLYCPNVIQWSPIVDICCWCWHIHCYYSDLVDVDRSRFSQWPHLLFSVVDRSIRYLFSIVVIDVNLLLLWPQYCWYCWYCCCWKRLIRR